jgi:hypothetical protein
MANFYRKLNDPTVYEDEAMTRGIKDEQQLRSLGGLPDWGPTASQTNIRTIGGTSSEVSAPTRTLNDLQGSNSRGKSYQIFNSALMDMLKKYQTLGTKPSQMTQIGLQNQQADKILAQSEGGFSPSQQSSMRNAQSQAIQPSITGSENRQQTYEKQLNAFGNVLNASKDYAQTQMEAQVKHEEDTRKSIQDAIDTYGSKAFEGLDESSLAQLEKDANYPKGYLTRKSKTIKEQELAISQQNADTAAQKATETAQEGKYVTINGKTYWDDGSGNPVEPNIPEQTKPNEDFIMKKGIVDKIIKVKKDGKGYEAIDANMDKKLNDITGTGTLRTEQWKLGHVWGTAPVDLINNIEQLVAKLSIESLIEAKAKGATFGALSDKELGMLAAAASKIGNAARRDKPVDLGGTVIGYSMSKDALVEALAEVTGYLDKANTTSPSSGTTNSGTTSGGIKWEILPDSFNSGSSGTPKATMRTDRSNNPTAFTTDIARLAGLKEGTDYTKGDSFGGGKYHTAKLIGDPVAKTIAVIDKIGFYTQSGKQRWTHTAIPQSQWNSLNYNQKKQVIKQMYQKEGNQGALNQFFA